MDLFVARHAPLVTSTLSGFDRLVFRGTSQPLVMPRGMFTFLCREGKRLLDLEKFMLETSHRVKAAALESVEKLGRPCRYVESSRTSKEDLVRRLLEEHPLRRAAFTREDNCVTWLANPELGQRLLDEQLETDWVAMLTPIARALNPEHDAIFTTWPMEYYWTAYQTEWATDVTFRDPGMLAAIYPRLVSHAVRHFRSPDVMRFLGRKVHGAFAGELTTRFKERREGVRVKHWVQGNSIKMYDKGGRVLRVETTIGRTKGFKVLRPPHEAGRGGPSFLAAAPHERGRSAPARGDFAEIERALPRRPVGRRGCRPLRGDLRPRGQAGSRRATWASGAPAADWRHEGRRAARHRREGRVRDSWFSEPGPRTPAPAGQAHERGGPP